jgi:hypothetical protein
MRSPPSGCPHRSRIEAAEITADIPQPPALQQLRKPRDSQAAPGTRTPQRLQRSDGILAAARDV